MKAVTSTEANREFSKLLREVAQGQTVQITSRGRPIATLSPVSTRTAQRQAVAQAQLLARLAGLGSSGPRNWTRDELYD
jgi:prevent-host-death family protein